MFVQNRIDSWISSIAPQIALPLRIELWNGRSFDFSQEAPRVTIRVPSPSAARYLLSPSLANLGTAYVEGIIGQTSERGGSVGVGVRLEVALPRDFITTLGYGPGPGWSTDVAWSP